MGFQGGPSGSALSRLRGASRLAAVLAVLAAVSAGCSFQSPSSTSASVQPIAPATASRNPSLPMTAPKYTVLVRLGSGLRTPGAPPWSATQVVSEGQVATIGDILLCTAGKSGPVRILSIDARNSQSPLTVVAFSTRQPGSEYAGFNPGSLEAAGFPASGAEVTPCHGTYRDALLGVPQTASAELGIEFEMTASTHEEDKELQLSYQSPDGSVRTLTIPLDVRLCANSDC